MSKKWAEFKWLLIVGVLAAALLLILLLAPGKTALTIGEQIPELRFKDIEGNAFFLNDTRGKVLLLNFWATWCEYCLEELPYLENLNRQFADEGLVIAAALKDPNNLDRALRIRDDNELTYTILLDEREELFRAFGVSALPLTALADRQGRIRFMHLGYSPKDQGAYEKEIRQLLQER